jgi:hypothetical protein
LVIVAFFDLVAPGALLVATTNRPAWNEFFLPVGGKKSRGHKVVG